MTLGARDPGGIAAAPNEPGPASGRGIRVRPTDRRGYETALSILAGLAIVGALYVGREIFIPFVVATLLAFILGPPVRRLRRAGSGRIFSVAIVVAVAVAVVASLGFVVGGQLTALVGQLPDYQRNVQTKLRALKQEGQSDIVTRATNMVETLQAELDGSRDQPKKPAPNVPPTTPPLPVEIHQPPPSSLQLLENFVAPLLRPLGVAALVLVFLIFLLLQREDLRDRLIRIAGSHDIHRTTAALDDAARRVSRYLLVQLFVNAAFGLQIGLGLWLIGIPNPLLWGLAAWVLRFIPVLGPILASLCPIVLGVAVDPGWSMALWTMALFFSVEVVTGNLIEPLLYGHSTGLSPLAYMVAITFWAWLWGPIGLLVATPLTVCLVVLGRHVPQFETIAVLLGNEEVLAPEETFYQRLLAGDAIEAGTQAEAFLTNRTLDAFFADVVLPALALAQNDVDRGSLSPPDQQRLVEHMLSVIDLVSDLAVEESNSPEERAAAPRLEHDVPVLCVPGRGALDMPAAVVVARLLALRDIGTRISSSMSSLATEDLSTVAIACQCFARAPSPAYVRIAHRRLRRGVPPNVPVLLALFGQTSDVERSAESNGAEGVATTLRETVEKLATAVAALRGTNLASRADNAAD
ncbi:AI-2E family transporter [Roseiterribacter gracilis]|uniref:ABC transporter permease n=1 Tax=Roseiterribacter gracilis TaxID=2812848 RepID=A0A8S8X7L1_9PROT|nr:ABC transporter permease [Rhodospirillales bacterium TMPK1]